MLDPTNAASNVLASAPDAVYVQELAGARSGINAVTGRIAVGCVGFVLRDGEPSGRLTSATLSTTLIDLLRTVIAVAADAGFARPGPVLAQTVLCDAGLVGLVECSRPHVANVGNPTDQNRLTAHDLQVNTPPRRNR